LKEKIMSQPKPKAKAAAKPKLGPKEGGPSPTPPTPEEVKEAETTAVVVENATEKIKSAIIDGIMAVAPNLTDADVEDLVELGKRADLRKLKSVMLDYKLANKLNDPELSGLVKFANELKPLFHVARTALGL
jgi:hypothetical protein